MLEKIVYKLVVITPYILFVVSFISLIFGIVKKSSQEPCKKFFITAIGSLLAGIIIFIIPIIVIMYAMK